MLTHLKAAVIAIVALFVVVGGAMATSRYLVTSTKQIKPSVLKQLKGNRGPRGPRGPAGPPGLRGATGLQGPAGAAGITHIDFQKSAEAFVCSDGSCPGVATATASCPAREIPISGGFLMDDKAAFVNVVLSNAAFSDSTGGGWKVMMGDIGLSTAPQGGFFATVTCAAGLSAG